MDDTPPGGGMMMTGILKHQLGRGMIILLDDGDWWRASGLPWKARHFINKRVTVHAIRVGFGAIDVVEIEGSGGSSARASTLGPSVADPIARAHSFPLLPPRPARHE